LKFKRLRIAVVDDEAHVRKALERLMRGAGFEVETYASGGDFLAALGRGAPDCAVLDLHMPVASGFEVQAEMHARGSKVPVVIITGHDSPGGAETAKAAGASAYLKKPVDGPELLEAILRAATTAQP
jgi:FixJ family two-component response regulator